jgi:prepilin-type N-terminal cleavage/methylation domain-containing protein
MKTSSPTIDPGFSLVEVLAAITIIGIITFMAIPNIVQLKTDGEENLARSRAEALNLAIASYVQATGASAAQTAWTAANNEARYDLIAPYISFAQADLSNSFMPGGYDATLPTTINPLSTKTTLTGPSGTINY